jgi:hypothetical protein
MKLQEIFDTVATHLLTQGRKAGRTTPLYHAPDGLTCAVGCLITEKAYSPDIEDLEVMHDDVLSALRLSGVKPLSYRAMELLQDLQEVHDDNHGLSWRNCLIDVAENHGLRSDVLEIRK